MVTPIDGAKNIDGDNMAVINISTMPESVYRIIIMQYVIIHCKSPLQWEILCC